MPPVPITRSSDALDLTPRIYQSSTVVGSPAAATETIVCQITGIRGDIPLGVGVFLSGVVSFTVGTSGTAIRVRIRQGTTAGSGTVVADTGAITGGVAAAALLSQDLQGVDSGVTGFGAPAVTSYHMSLQVTGGAAASTVSATNLFAIAA